MASQFAARARSHRAALAQRPRRFADYPPPGKYFEFSHQPGTDLKHVREPAAGAYPGPNPTNPAFTETIGLCHNVGLGCSCRAVEEEWVTVDVVREEQADGI